MFNEGLEGWQILVTTLIILALISATAWLIVNARRSKKSKQSPLKKEMDLLKERYARGEITKQGFKAREQELMSSPFPPSSSSL